MKKILGLDLGTNSAGWALIDTDFESKSGSIIGLGTRIIPMSQDILGDFNKGNSVSQTARRTELRSIRRLRERYLLRRERLHRVLYLLKFLPEHYANDIDFEKRLGQFKENKEPKLPYDSNGFLFKESFSEMLADFKSKQPDLLVNEKNEPRLVPSDWTLYYLRKKALTQRIRKEELAWILLNFNQKRGYYQLRGEEEEENPNKLVELHSLEIVDVTADDTKRGQDIWYSVILENGWIYRYSSKIPIYNWKGKIKDFIVTTELDDKGNIKTDKEGKEKRSLSAPKEDEWILLKKKTEREISLTGATVGAYIYENLLKVPNQKIKGKLVRTIERKFYKIELKQILEKQIAFHSELQDKNLFNSCIKELYRYNEGHQQLLVKKDFIHLFIEDILFYQRPLKSKKSLIANCTLESRNFKDNNGILHKQYLKAIPKSNPYYQEFRLWQWIYNLSIYQKEGELNVTAELLNTLEDLENLFEFLNDRKEIKQEQLLKFLLEQKGFKGKALSTEVAKYRWNYVADKIYPCNETRSVINNRISKIEKLAPGFLTFDVELYLWHILYSVTDKEEYEKALRSFARKYSLDEKQVLDSFKRVPPFKRDYGSFSEKAIKKLLALMRLGKYWCWDNIDERTQNRIEKIRTGEFDEQIKERVRKHTRQLSEEKSFQGLPLWLAQYVIYGFHAESQNAGKWSSIEDLENFIDKFKQHSLRNPIVEQVVLETLRVVRDVWKEYGNGAQNFFDEIHIELGREMKSPSDERKRITDQTLENERTNMRIKILLAELLHDPKVENVRPHSPMQQEILKIYEDGVLNSGLEISEDILKISKAGQPSIEELRKYKLWLEQKYRSPYTGAIIPLNKLFTSEYEIEHIIPQSRYFDDGFSNKVICESAVNKLKDNQVGLEFIKNHHGQIVETGLGKEVKIFEVKDYEEFIKQHYSKNRSKLNKLLLEDIPEKMIERQLNDTRYISKYISAILSNIVRSETNDDGVNSKNVIQTNGKITGILKQDWGLNDVWNDLVLPRFERMNQVTNSTGYTVWNENHQKFLPTVPLDKSKNFSKKRIDHRHHAMDALVIACATRDHINLLNNLYAKSSIRYDLNRKLRNYELVSYHSNIGEKIERQVPKEFLKPWNSFTVDTKNSLEQVIVSFKQNLRIINKATNNYEGWIEKNGEMVKELRKQNGQNWIIRKSLHKDTVAGVVNLYNLKVPKGKIVTATRKSIDPTFDLKVIESITDTGIRKILKNYLTSKTSPEIAFSSEGLEELNKNIRAYNDGKFHQPIYKARVFEVGSKFALGQAGNKSKKYVEADKGTNLFFAVYQNSNRERSYETIPLNIVVERRKQGLSPVPMENEKGEKILFSLSPNDLVYLPNEEELVNYSNLKFDHKNNKQIDRIYKVVSFTGSQIFFVKHEVASPIADKVEFSTLNKMERSIDEQMIKKECIKLKVNRLGKC